MPIDPNEIDIPHLLNRIDKLQLWLDENENVPPHLRLPPDAVKVLRAELERCLDLLKACADD